MASSAAWLVWLGVAAATGASPPSTGEGPVVLPLLAKPGVRIGFYDGRAEVASGEVRPLGGTWRRDGEGVRWSHGASFTARMKSRAIGSLTAVDVIFEALGQDAWVRTQIAVPWRFAGPWRWFDGRGARDGLTGEVHQSRILGTFPATGAFDGASGLSVGLDPSVWVSTFDLGVVSSDGRQGELRLSVPLALSPGRPEKLTFCLSRFEPGPFGFMPLFESWHAAFPGLYRPAEGIDPRVLMGCAAGAADDEPDKKIRPKGFDAKGICAGARVGWEWKYAKFKSGGDMLGRPEEWALVKPEAASAPLKGTLADFRKWRLANFRYTNDTCGIAPLFYTINWVAEELAEPFRDSLIRADDVSDGRGVKITKWIHTFSTDLRAFPYANSLGDRLQHDMSELAHQLPLAGFAHDVAIGGSRYRPVRWVAGRAYDQRGVWVDEGIGIANVLRYAHSLRSADGKYRLGTSANFTGETHYAIATATDNPVFEGSPYGALLNPRLAMRDRWLLGAKPRCWYTQWYTDDIGNLVDYEQMSPEELLGVLRSRWDTSILWSFRFGWLPSPDLAYGYAPMRRALPALHDCVKAGWHAVPAMTSDQPLWLARYGEGLETRLVVMNPHDSQAVTARVRVHCKWLGKGGFVFADADGSDTVNRFDGQDSVLTLDLPPRSWKLLVCVGRRNGGPALLKTKTEPRFEPKPKAPPDTVGVVEVHLGHTAPFFTLSHLASTRALYEKAGVIGHELPEE
ncbi:MAG: hypothetical protein HYU66_04420 [Armatimonadetes bacterium]|nr:hypothetical protein [Armatimonadota bacterium]